MFVGGPRIQKVGEIVHGTSIPVPMCMVVAPMTDTSGKGDHQRYRPMPQFP